MKRGMAASRVENTIIISFFLPSLELLMRDFASHKSPMLKNNTIEEHKIDRLILIVSMGM